MSFTTPDFWIALSQIILINIVLSGDNAVVIAMASRSLPPSQQRKAILFGSVSYLHNFARNHVNRRVLDGELEPLGKIAPGGVFGFNFGVGLALNDKALISFGYDHSSIARTRQNGVPVAGSVRTQLGTLLTGFSYRISDRRTVNIAVGAGLTRDTPDVQLSFRLPVTF